MRDRVRRPVVSRTLGDLDALVLLPVGVHERSGGDHRCTGAALLGCQRGGGIGEDSELWRRSCLQELNIGSGEIDLRRVSIYDVGTRVRGQVTLRQRRVRSEILDRVEGLLHRIRRHRCAVTEGGVVAKDEREASGVGADLPTLGEPRGDLSGVGILIGQRIHHGPSDIHGLVTAGLGRIGARRRLRQTVAKGSAGLGGACVGSTVTPAAAAGEDGAENRDSTDTGDYGRAFAGTE